MASGRREAYVCGVRAVYSWSMAGAIDTSPVCNYNIKELRSIVDLCPLRIIKCTFPFLSERSERRTPPAERSAFYKHTYVYRFFLYLIITTCLAHSESTTFFCRFYHLCFVLVLWFLYVLAYRATLFSPKKNGKRKSRFCFFSGLAGSLSLFFTGSLKFLSHHQSFFPFFFFHFVCVRVLRERHRERARRRRGCQRVWRVGGGSQGARSPFSRLGVTCASRHERSMNGLCLASICRVCTNL